MTPKEAYESLCYEIYEEGHCSYIEEELDIAIKALEKQIPKKPKEYVDHEVCIDWICPTCERFHRTEWRTKHCSDCGQAIDWSEEE